MDETLAREHEHMTHDHPLPEQTTHPAHSREEIARNAAAAALEGYEPVGPAGF